jgi:hypothetical protein
LESLLAVALVDGVVECLPLRLADAFALSFGQLRQEIADAMNLQCWRSEAGQQCSMALISPGAPSATISIGAPSPRAITGVPQKWSTRMA